MSVPRVLPRRALAALFTLAATSVSAQPAPELRVPAGTPPVVLRAARVLDGTGRTLRNQDVTVQGGRITAMRASAGPLPAGFEFRATYDPDDQFLTTLERA